MLDSASIGMIAAMVVMVICSAYFSATETAFTSLNRIRLKSKADAGNRRAAKALELVDKYDNLLSTILVGNNIVNLTASSLSTLFFTVGLHLQNGAVIATAVITIVVLIFGEVSPKSMAKEFPEQFAMFSAPIIGTLMVVLTPVNWLFAMLKKGLSKLMRGGDKEGITEEELVTMVDQAESEGGLDQHESKLIRAAIEFHDLEVEEILTPRVDMVAVRDTDSMEDIASAFAESGYSRLPVYHEDIDNIIGVIHEKDFHAARYRGITSVKDFVGPMLYTTGNTKISELLRILQKEKAHMVVVVDEYGGTEGLVRGAGGRDLGRARRGDRGVPPAERRQLPHLLLRRPHRSVRSVRHQGGVRCQHHLRLGHGAHRPGARGGGPLRLRRPGRDRHQGGPPPGAGDPGGGAPHREGDRRRGKGEVLRQGEGEEP